MDLDELIESLPIHRPPPMLTRPVQVVDITDDSRTVLPGSLFVARPGLAFDARVCIADAVRDGASAILTDAVGAERVDRSRAVCLIAEDVERAGAALAERLYRNPSSALRLVGITGTNGKTTVAHLAHGLVNAGVDRCGLIGTVQIDDGREVAEAEMTTPPAIELSRTLATMVESGCVSAVMEVSSHALERGRVSALSFDVGVFTTLGTDHMDFHESSEAYLRSKRRLFEMLPGDGVAIVNADDAAYGAILEGCRARVVRCSLVSGDATVRVLERRVDGLRVALDGAFGSFEADLPLTGDHNAMNLLMAVQIAHELGADSASIARGLECPSVPRGRLEPVGGGDIDVFVDFAHTPDALERTLTEVRRAMEGSRPGSVLWVVFGCGGEKDRTKRPVMGEIAAGLAHRVVLTSDNPRSESSEAIIREILAGIPREKRNRVDVHADRELAIAHAVLGASPGDVIVLAGKGHERVQTGLGRGGAVRTVAFDDVACARTYIMQRMESE